MKLNGWKRVGIVASVVWAIGGYIHTLDTENATAMGVYSMIYNDCVGNSTNGRAWGSEDQCSKERDASLSASYPSAVESAAFVAVVPIPLGWGFVYLMIFIVRWIKRGFRPVPSD
jgi:hypothetical protein